MINSARVASRAVDAKERAKRIRVGMTGLAAILLMVGMTNLFVTRTRGEVGASVSSKPAPAGVPGAGDAGTKTEAHSPDPLLEPAQSAAPAKPATLQQIPAGAASVPVGAIVPQFTQR